MFYFYKVTYWDTYDSEEKTARGLVYGKDYGKAANKVVEAYDKTCVIDMYLYEIDAKDVIDEEEIEYVFKHDERINCDD